jgi:hypothetical protein
MIAIQLVLPVGVIAAFIDWHASRGIFVNRPYRDSEGAWQPGFIFLRV